MQTFKWILFLIGFSISIKAQVIQVVSIDDNSPIAGVAIFNNQKTNTAITDIDGYTDLSSFSDSEAIFFQHISYELVSFSKEEIRSNGNKVYLTLTASSLDEIIVSVSKFGQKRKDIPQQIVTLTGDDVLFNNPQTAADLLETSGQVYVQKSQLGGGSPLIRGFSTNRLLITVDGVRFNTAIFRGGNVQNVISLDPFSIDRTEVILGPGSVVYGSDAVGGVMNFYTKKPSFSVAKGWDLSGSALARYASANNENTGSFQINIGGKEWAFLTSVSYSDFDDLRMGSNGPDDYLRKKYVTTVNGVDTEIINDDPEVQRFTGYEQLNIMQKLRYSPSEEWDVNLGLFYTTTSDYPRYDRLLREREGTLRYAEWYYGPQEWMSGNLQIAHSQENVALFDESKLTLSYQRFKESRNDRNFGESILFETDETVWMYSAALDLTKKITSNTQAFYGLEYVFNEVGSEGKQTNINTQEQLPDPSRYPDGSTWQSLAAYASLKSNFSKRLAFQAGVRYNQVILKADFTENNAFFNFPFTEANINTGALTGNAGLTWQASSILAWRVNIGTAFRAPNVDDVGKVFDSEIGSVVVPNPDLDSEYALNTEVGALLNFNETVKLDLAGYYTRLKDALVRRDFNLDGRTEIEYQGEPSTVQAIQNLGSARVWGFEAGLEINFSELLQLTSQLSITEGYTIEENGSREPIRHVAPIFGNTQLEFKKNKWRVQALAEYNGRFTFEDLAPSQRNNDFLYAKDANGNPFAPAWYTLSLVGQYQLLEALQLTASLENITDQRYRPYSSGISAPGRNLILGARYKF